MSVRATKEGLVPRFERNGPAKPLADGWGSRARPRRSMNRDGCDEEAVP
jgi:hypothetical protein